MAFLIKKSTGILTLKVTLLTHEGQLELSLERFRSGSNVLESVWRCRAVDFGVPEAISGAADLLVTTPITIMRALQDAVSAAAYDPSEPLWLHLVKPYGFLGAMNWEAELGAALQRPIFRLPDFLETLRTHPSRLNIAVVIDLPDDQSPETMTGLVEALLRTMQDSVGRPATFHLFAPGILPEQLPSTPGLSVLMAVLPDDPRVSLLTWVTNSLTGLAVDWVQLVMLADAEEVTPYLIVTGAPAEGRGVDYVSPSDVSLFLGAVSAWGCGFTALPGRAPSSLRYFADATAQVRPGPVLFSDLGLTGWEASLRGHLRRLFKDSDSAILTHGAFLYAQPERVGAVLDLPPAPQAQASLTEALASVKEQPSWAISASSFLTSARQEWGLGTVLGSVSAPTTLSEPGVWSANTVGGFERTSQSSTARSAAEQTLESLTSLTAEIISGSKF